MIPNRLTQKINKIQTESQKTLTVKQISDSIRQNQTNLLTDNSGSKLAKLNNFKKSQIIPSQEESDTQPRGKKKQFLNSHK